jgi:hypothetical protein
MSSTDSARPLAREWRRLFTRLLEQVAAPVLLLVTPFAIFVQHHRYGFTHPEVLVCLLALTALGIALGVAGTWSSTVSVVTLAVLLTLFVDIQFRYPDEKVGFMLTGLTLLSLVWLARRHAARLVAILMATVLASSLLMPAASAKSQPRAAAGTDGGGESNLPLVIHVVLDEHLGLEGLPEGVASPAFARQLQSFFVDRGFMLFGRAYSEHAETFKSLSHVLNLMPGEYHPELFGPGRTSTYDLKQNKYFNDLAAKGHRIRVYQPDHLDLCADKSPAVSCRTYRATSLEALEQLSATPLQKAAVVGGMFADRSYLYKKVRERYKNFHRARQPNTWLPAWDWERRRVGPLSSMAVASEVMADVSKARRGDVIFAHFLLPHYPYIYDSNCRARPPAEWLDRTEVDAGSQAMGNTAGTRAQRYARYLEQVGCVQKQLGQMLAAIPSALQQDAIVVIQGDHGSRITLVDPPRRGSSPSDYVDSYSTLFAVRAPAIGAGYDRRLAPVTCLMRTLVDSGFSSVSGVEACSANPIVFLEVDDRVVPAPLPPFAAGHLAAAD